MISADAAVNYIDNSAISLPLWLNLISSSPSFYPITTLQTLPVPSPEVLIQGLSLVLLGCGRELEEAGLFGEEKIDATFEGLVEFEVSPLVIV